MAAVCYFLYCRIAISFFHDAFLDVCKRHFRSQGREARISTSCWSWIARHKVDDGKLAKDSGFFKSIAFVWSVPLLRTLTYMTIPMWLVIYIIEFHYYRTMNSVFDNQDELTGFLGLFVSFCSICGFMLQVLFTGRMLQRFGVGATLLIYPFSLTIGTVSLIFFSLFPPTAHHGLMNVTILVALSRFCDIAIYFSIFDSASQLLYNSLPDEKRGQGRAFIAGIVMPLSTAVAGGLLLWTNNSSEPMHNIAFIGLNLAFLLVVVALNVNSDYLKALLFNLNSRDMDLRSQAMSEFGKLEDTETRFVLLQSVSSPDADSALFALDMLKNTAEGHEELVEDLCEAIGTVQPRVKIGILQTVEERGERAQIPVAQSLLSSEDPTIRAAAIRAIGRIGDNIHVDALAQYLDDDDADVRVETVIAALRHKASTGKKDREIQTLNALAKSKNLDDTRRAAHIISEIRRDDFTTMLLSMAPPKDDARQEIVIRAMSRIPDSRVVTYLTSFLDHPVLWSLASESLIAIGGEAFADLLRELKADTNSPAIRAALIRCLGKIGKPDAIPIVSTYLANYPTRVMNAAIETLASLKQTLLEIGQSDEDAVNQYFPESVRALVADAGAAIANRIEKDHACLAYIEGLGNPTATALLVDAIKHSNNARESLALDALGVLNDPRFVQTVRMNFASTDRRTKAEALEMVEGLGPEGRALAGTLSLKHFPDPAAAAEDHPEIFRELISQSRDPWLCVTAMYAVGQLGLAGFESEINKLQKHEVPMIRYNAALALKKLGFALGKEISEERLDAMALDMERILFLRGVVLFSELEGRDLEWINEIAKEIKLKAGDVIYKEGDAAESFFVILKGKVRIVKGSDKTLDLLEEKESFGEDAIIDGSPRTVRMEAHSTATILEISSNEFLRLIHARPRMAFSLNRILLTRIRSLENRVLETA
ncbi:MAG: HEAT repeat domain-containing protein [Spirochaetia bacterium]|nr:HEAT repeat domain-containing protein [Spirochaetia bacterium]